MNKDSPIIEIIDTSHHMQLSRINDVFIMQHFIDLDIAPNDLLLLNEMRMSIRALTLADIVTSDGKRITATAWRLRGGNNLQ